MNRVSARQLALTALAVFGVSASLAGCGDKDEPRKEQSEPVLDVVMMEARSEPVDLTYDYSGRIAAFREVEVRTRVPGVLLRREYVEGARVQAGSVLFRLDPAPARLAVANAEAQLQQARLQLEKAQRDSAREEALFQAGSSTAVAHQDALSQKALGQAHVSASMAQWQAAQLDLGYTSVVAPMTGVTSTQVLPEGSLVSSNTLLTRITQLDPVYVNFSFSSEDAAEIKQHLRSASTQGREEGRLGLRLILGDGQAYAQEGHVDFTSSSINTQTGTIQARGVVTNPENRLIPGQFVRAEVTGLKLRDALIVPQAAVMQRPQGTFVYVVGADSKAEARAVVLGRAVTRGWIVRQGLTPGERVITEGLIKVKQGSIVRSVVPSGTTGNGAVAR
ncbi:MAG: efflux RND transporter periplasmic adaptor subunit [Cystobacter sp.]